MITIESNTNTGRQLEIYQNEVLVRGGTGWLIASIQVGEADIRAALKEADEKRPTKPGQFVTHDDGRRGVTTSQTYCLYNAEYQVVGVFFLGEAVEATVATSKLTVIE